jgi:methionyl-tRNA formyltransferase
MKKLMIAGFGQPLLDLYGFLEQQFDIVGVILDYERREKFASFHESLESKAIKIYSFEDLPELKPDVVVVFNYIKIIDVKNITVPLLNIHMGVLPVYRGNNANASALLNGDRNVGYTLHEVSDILDGGKIFYKFTYEIQQGQTYFHGKSAMTEDLKTNLPAVLEKILDGEIQGVDQEDEAFIYSTRLYPEDGVISNWDQTTDDIINRHIIFARPLGTGLKMMHQGNMIEISKLSVIPHFKVSKGFPGAVVLKNNDGSIWIKTRDTALSIDELLIDGNAVLPATLYKIGERI